MKRLLMKSFIVVALGLLYASTAFAQRSAKAAPWKEMETFHEVMAKTFHPMEEGNLQPIMARAGEMAEKAKLWADTKAPAQFDKPAIKDLLVKLKDESKALAELVAAKGSEADIKKSLTALHDRFHEITGACKTDGHGKKHKH